MLDHNAAAGCPRYPVTAWSSLAHPLAHRHEAWAQTLSEYFLPWTLSSPRQPAISASVRQRALDDCRFVQCASDPISGFRRTGEISRTNGDFYNVLYVLSGMELLKFQGREVPLTAGQFILWDSDRRMEFSVQQRLEKLTLVIPERVMRNLLPNAQDFVGTPIDGSHGLGRLFTSHLRSVHHEIWNMSATDLAHVRSPTLELLARTYASLPGRRRLSVRAETFRRVRSYILEHLSDPDLTPQSIAKHNQISVRYLHLLFGDVDDSVSAWIRSQRLERCAEDLANPALAQQSITRIAHRWGFNDLGHFGKLLHRKFGSSPREYRRRSLEQQTRPVEPRA
jgi:AraC-like DNA-binding protein